MYPILPKIFNLTTKEARNVYDEITRWGSTLINQLDARDNEIDGRPSTNIRVVVTISSINRPKKGDVKTKDGKKVRWDGKRWVPVRTGNALSQVQSAVRTIDEKLKLTNKKGDIKKVGGESYIFNGTRWVRYRF